MKSDANSTCQFKSFTLNISERQLLQGGYVIHLTPKAFDLLVYLVQRAGHLVEKDELMRSIWPDALVEEGNLSRTIHALRRALGEDDNGNKFIETVPTKGYRFVAKVEDAATPATPRPETAMNDGMNDGMTDEATAPVSDSAGRQVSSDKPPAGFPKPSSRRVVVIGVLAVFLVASASILWAARNSSRPTVGVTPGDASKTRSSAAYEKYQQGRLLIERRKKGDLVAALASFEEAIGLDPDYAAAFAGKADAKILMFWQDYKHDDIIQARNAIDKAVELDESSSYAQTLRCRLIGTYEWKFKEAEEVCRKAVRLNPNDHEAQRELAFALNVLGRQEEALDAVAKAIAIAPTSFNKRARGMLLYYARRFPEAIAQFEEIRKTDPNFSERDGNLNIWLSDAYAMNGDYPNAVEAYIRRQHLRGEDDSIPAIRMAFEKQGWPGVLETKIDRSVVKDLNTPAVYAQLGEKDRAFDALNQLVERRQIMLIHIARDARFDSLRDDPRFDRVLGRIGIQ